MNELTQEEFNELQQDLDATLNMKIEGKQETVNWYVAKRAAFFAGEYTEAYSMHKKTKEMEKKANPL